MKPVSSHLRMPVQVIRFEVTECNAVEGCCGFADTMLGTDGDRFSSIRVLTRQNADEATANEFSISDAIF